MFACLRTSDIPGVSNDITGVLNHWQAQKRIADSLVMPHYGPDDIGPDWNSAYSGCAEQNQGGLALDTISQNQQSALQMQNLQANTTFEGPQSLIPEMGHLSPGEHKDFNLPIDPADMINFQVSSLGAPLNIVLRNPSGQPFYEEENVSLEIINVSSPQPGAWQIMLENPPANTKDSVFICTAYIDNTITISSVLDKPTYDPNESAVLTVSVGGADVNLASLSAEVSMFSFYDAESNDVVITLKDDGIWPDQASNDGILSTSFKTGSSYGIYGLAIRVSGSTNTGYPFTRAILSGLTVKLTGDLKHDWRVDFMDFSVLAYSWLSEEGDFYWNQACDISDPNDNIIDGRDLSVFAENWLAGK